MQRIEVVGLIYNINTLTSVFFQGATANLAHGVLILDNLQGEPGQSVPGTYEKGSAAQHIEVGQRPAHGT